MCCNPRIIKNPYFGSKPVGVLQFKDTTAAYIEVPCGTCPDCIMMKQTQLIQRCQMESIDNDLFFCTLTYNNKMLPHITSNGFVLRYADMSDFSKAVKRIRNDNLFGRPFKYLAVSEFGSSSHRPHIHVIFSVSRDSSIPVSTQRNRSYLRSEALRLGKVMLSQWKVNVGSRRNPVYLDNCSYVRKGNKSTFDFHYIEPVYGSGQDDVAYYVTKYILKPDEYSRNLQVALRLNHVEHDYRLIWNKVRPQLRISKGFGLFSSGSREISPSISDHIRKCINRSTADENTFYPVFHSLNQASSSPLSLYYRKRFLTADDMYKFFYKNNPDYCNDYDSMRSVTTDIDPVAVQQKYHRFNHALYRISHHGELPLLFEDEKIDIDDFLYYTGYELDNKYRYSIDDFPLVPLEEKQGNLFDISDFVSILSAENDY